MTGMAKSPGWLAPALSYIPQWLAYQMRQSEQVGFTLAIAHRGTVVLDMALGHADLNSGQLLTPRHRYGDDRATALAHGRDISRRTGVAVLGRSRRVL